VTAAIESSSCGSLNGYLSGASIITPQSGIAVFDTLNIYCYPGGSANLTYTASLDGLYGNTYALTYSEIVTFRGCTDGEILKDNLCVECPDGSYLFAYDSSTVACTSCPAHSDSCYGNKVAITAGYWRISTLSKTFLECPLGAIACQGGYDVGGIDESSSVATSNSSAGSRKLATSSTQRSCADGYIGPLCGVCDEGYYLKGSSCMSCSNRSGAQQAIVAYIIIPLIMLGIVAAAVVFVSVGNTADTVEEVIVGISKHDLDDSKGKDDEAGADIEGKGHAVSPEVETSHAKAAGGARKVDNIHIRSLLVNTCHCSPMFVNSIYRLFAMAKESWKDFKSKRLGSKIRILITLWQVQ
jgi:hypothetical protein